MCLLCLRKINSEDGQVYSVCILQFSCFTKHAVKSQNINKQNVNIAEEILTDYSFLSRCSDEDIRPNERTVYILISKGTTRVIKNIFGLDSELPDWKTMFVDLHIGIIILNQGII